MSEIISIGLAVLSSLLAALGQLGLKFGSMKFKITINDLIKNYALLVGVLLYGVSAVVFIIALKGNELSVLYPIAALNYVWVSLLSMKYLKERMNLYKWLGILLILIGIAFIV